ncbi:hypothetical protein [Roseateles sp. L2-2]|uniref:hypothetical protein n=1 Tax=Roseateles TaxID=93681 RepID=UPI003D36797B
MKARLGELDDTVVRDEDGALELASDNLRAMGALACLGWRAMKLGQVDHRFALAA